jgi:hypothetical protein
MMDYADILLAASLSWFAITLLPVLVSITIETWRKS